MERRTDSSSGRCGVSVSYSGLPTQTKPTIRSNSSRIGKDLVGRGVRCDRAGRPFTVVAISSDRQAEVLDGAGTGRVIFFFPKWVRVEHLADDDEGQCQELP